VQANKKTTQPEFKLQQNKMKASASGKEQHIHAPCEGDYSVNAIHSYI
jgi:hypothetical protein